MNEFKLKACLSKLDNLVDINPEILMDDASVILMKEMDIDRIEAALAIRVWVQLRSLPSSKWPPKWSSV